MPWGPLSETGELTYNEFTSDVTISATAEAGATTIVTAPATTFDGSPVMVEFVCNDLSMTTASVYMTVYLFEDGNSIGSITQANTPNTAGNMQISMFGKRRITPSAGSHTYSVRAARDAGGSGAVVVQAGAGGSGNKEPGYIRITKA